MKMTAEEDNIQMFFLSPSAHNPWTPRSERTKTALPMSRINAARSLRSSLTHGPYLFLFRSHAVTGWCAAEHANRYTKQQIPSNNKSNHRQARRQQSNNKQQSNNNYTARPNRGRKQQESLWPRKQQEESIKIYLGFTPIDRGQECSIL